VGGDHGFGLGIIRMLGWMLLRRESVAQGVRAIRASVMSMLVITVGFVAGSWHETAIAQAVPATMGQYGAPYFANPGEDDAIPGAFLTIKEAADAILQQDVNNGDQCPGYTLETEGNLTTVTGAGGWCESTEIGQIQGTWIPFSDSANDGADCDCDGTSPNVGDPINAATGNGFEVQEDGHWGAWLRFARYYNTSTSAFVRYFNSIDRSGQVGVNWTTNYVRRIFYQQQAGPNVPAGVLYDTEDGKEYQFAYINGTLQPASIDYTQRPPVITARPDVHVQMQLSQKVDGTVTAFDVFRPDTLNHEHFDGNGVLQTITDDTGHVTTLAYSTSTTPNTIASEPGLLITVTDPVGRHLQLTYDSSNMLATVTGPDGQAIRYAHSRPLYITKITYPNGLIRTFDFTAVNGIDTLSAIEDDGKPVTSWTYDTTGAVTSASQAAGANAVSVAYTSTTSTVTFPEGVARTMGYTVVNKRAKLASVDGFCLSCGSSAAISYDGSFNPTVHTDFRGYQTVSEYNTAGLETTRTEAFGTSVARKHVTMWDTNLRKPLTRTLADASGKLVAKQGWAYNSRGQTTAACVFDAEVNASYTCVPSGAAPASVRRTVYIYCDAVSSTCPKIGLLLTVDGSRTDVTDVTTYAYADSFGDVASVTDAVGHVTSYPTYDAVGRPTRVVSSNGVVTDYGYDVNGNVKSLIIRANSDGTPSAADATWSTVYDHFDHVSSLTDPDGVVLTYLYDDAHRLVGTVDGQANRLAQFLNAAGQVTGVQIIDGNQHIVSSRTSGYTATGLLSAKKDAMGRAVFTAPNDGFDANGNLVKSTDGVGTQSQRTYDPLNRVSSVIQDTAGTGPTANTTISYLYDALDNVTQVTDPNGLLTTQAFDGYGQRKSLTSPDTGLSTFTYDLAGDEATRKDARGITRTTHYDAINRKVSETFSQTGADTNYSYDEANTVTGCSASFPVGHLTRMVDAGVTTSFCYDRHGNVSQKRQTIASQLDITSYTYTPGNRLLSEVRADGSTVNYGHDALGNTTTVSVVAPSGAVTSVITAATYLPFGPLSNYTLASGATVTRSYDANYQINDVVAPGFSEHLARNVMGDVVAQGDSPGANPATESYSYDPLRRLTSTLSATGTALETYTYNATGDRLSKSGGLVDNGTVAYTAGTHQVSAVGNLARVNDGAGNTTAAGQAGGTFGFGYDARGQLTIAQFNGGTVGSYTYNALAQRVARTSPGASPASSRFTYDEAGHVLAETGNTTPRSYVWFGDLPVAVLDTSGAATAIRYVHADAVGTPRAVTDSIGNVVWAWVLAGNSFGEKPPTGSYLFNLRFPGQYADAETGLNYNVHRYYDPSVGRYLTSDPLELAGGPSTFAYAASRPLSMVDPSGLFGGPPEEDAIEENIPEVNREIERLNRQTAEEAREAANRADHTQYVPPIPASEFAPLGECAARDFDAAQEMSSPGSSQRNTPNFVVAPDGTVLPIPEGAEGPVPLPNGRGYRYEGGSGGYEFDPKTAGLRIMDPTTTGKYPYPYGYATYENKTTQGVDPFTGKTISDDNPLRHIPFGPPNK